jgi:microcystin-dependent protein
MGKRNINFDIWWPDRPILPRSFWRYLVPHPGTFLVTLLVIGGLLWAQSVGALPLGRPQAAPSATSTGTIAYQGRLADSDGAPLTGTYSMIFRLYDAATGGMPLWEEQWTGSNGVKVSDGLFSVMLGSLTAIPQVVITGHDQLFLGITVGTDDEMTPRVQLGSVPFAVQALTVPDGSVTTAKIASAAVTTANIASGAVTADKLASGLSLIPQGTIVMWSGAISSIPSGWALCDGANGTPDLRDRFILGAGAGENPGEAGGSNTKTLTVNELPSHTHAFTTNTTGNHSHGIHVANDDDFEEGDNKGGVDDTSGSGISTTSAGDHYHTGTTNATGTGAAFDIRPKYFKLVFIMKL